MRSIQVIEAAVSRVTEINQFVHASNFLNNAIADYGLTYPVAFLVRPVNIAPRVVDSGHLIEVARCSIFFSDLQGELVDAPDAHAIVDPKIEVMRIAILKFFKALQEDEQTARLTVSTYRDVTNFFDASLCGIIAEFTIELRMENPYPCPDEI
jgi:hypothetical protein